MNAVITKHPFPLAAKPDHWLLPAMLAPSFYVMFSFSFYWGSGNPALCSPTLLMLTGLIALAYCGRSIYRDKKQPLHRQVCHYCALVLLVYLQLLLPRLWGWPAN
ncbi:hypothetical protein [Cerasicoccus frondis]|uniref:hypothetical protein n=1 Tax=Cerasicoccus frondis TaxID=490090 RepID=UPI002852C3D8|nr:hypothetical protein [Cerasicoccus frondis]